MKYVNENGGVWSKELGQEIGIHTGDQILKINGNPIANFEDLSQAGVYYRIIQAIPFYATDRR